MPRDLLSIVVSPRAIRSRSAGFPRLAACISGTSSERPFKADFASRSGHVPASWVWMRLPFLPQPLANPTLSPGQGSASTAPPALRTPFVAPSARPPWEMRPQACSSASPPLLIICRWPMDGLRSKGLGIDVLSGQLPAIPSPSLDQKSPAGPRSAPQRIQPASQPAATEDPPPATPAAPAMD